MFKQLFKREMPETLTNPACDTAEFESHVERETERLLRNPMEIMDVDIEEFLQLYKIHRKDPAHMAHCIEAYLSGLAESQAREQQ